LGSVCALHAKGRCVTVPDATGKKKKSKGARESVKKKVLVAALDKKT